MNKTSKKKTYKQNHTDRKMIKNLKSLLEEKSRYNGMVTEIYYSGSKQ